MPDLADVIERALVDGVHKYCLHTRSVYPAGKSALWVEADKGWCIRINVREIARAIAAAVEKERK